MLVVVQEVSPTAEATVATDMLAELEAMAVTDMLVEPEALRTSDTFPMVVATGATDMLVV